MIKHIVMMKLAEAADQEERKEKLAALLEDLEGKIEEIKLWEVGRNISTKASAFDLVLISGFDTLEDLDTYRVHPDHVKVLDYIKEVVSGIHVVDYELG